MNNTLCSTMSIVTCYLLCSQEFSVLYEEASFFELTPLQAALDQWKSQREDVQLYLDCVLVQVCPGLGEKVSVSAQRAVMEEVFPELQDILKSAPNATWKHSATHAVRFPISAYCQLTSVQVQQRLYNRYTDTKKLIEPLTI